VIPAQHEKLMKGSPEPSSPSQCHISLIISVMDLGHQCYNVEIGFSDAHTRSHSAGLFWSRDLKVNGDSRTFHAYSSAARIKWWPALQALGFEGQRATASSPGQRSQIGQRTGITFYAAECGGQSQTLAGMSVICSYSSFPPPIYVRGPLLHIIGAHARSSHGSGLLVDWRLSRSGLSHPYYVWISKCQLRCCCM